MPVTRCVCSNITFAALKEAADKKNLKSVAALQVEREFGKSCKLCVPYVKQMLLDGSVSFDEIITES